MRSSKQNHVVMPATVLALLLAVAGVSSLPGQVSTPGERVPLIISFQNTPGATEQALVHAFGGDIKYSYTIVPAIAASVPQTALNGLRNHPLVTAVEDDIEITAYEIDPTDPEYSNVWGVRRILAPEAHAGSETEASVTGAGVKVAVIDSGVDCSHPELSIACNSDTSGKDFVDDDDDPDDEYGHGTHVSGTIAAHYGDTNGVAGVAPDARIVPLRVLNASGSGSFSDVIAALQWIQGYNLSSLDPIRITNNSYGSSRDPGTAVEAAFDAIAGSVLHVAAAGNATFATCRKVGYPAAYDSVVAVGATDSTDSWAYFSCYGAGLELSAPGVDIVSTYLNSQYAIADGTSMASPHVAGAAALVIDANFPGPITPSEVRQRLRDTSVDIGTSGWDKYTGYGRVNAYEASRTGPGTDDPPTVNIISPGGGTEVSGTVTISASAGDDNGVYSVEFFVAGVSISTDTYGDDGWSATWDTIGYTGGPYAITATATDTLVKPEQAAPSL